MTMSMKEKEDMTNRMNVFYFYDLYIWRFIHSDYT